MILEYNKSNFYKYIPQAGDKVTSDKWYYMYEVLESGTTHKSTVNIIFHTKKTGETLYIDHSFSGIVFGKETITVERPELYGPQVPEELKIALDIFG